MDVVWGILKFLQGGVVSNWYGLACPSHRGAPNLGTLAAAVLFGFCLGFGLCAIILAYILGLRLAPGSSIKATLLQLLIPEPAVPVLA